jgi:nucleoside-diphosphate-sugar epimerase
VKIFVTGGNGYIGSHLAHKLAARGDTVVCVVRDPAKVKTNAALPNLQYVRGDVTEPASLKEPMRGADAVYHLAGIYRYGRQAVSQMRAVNVEGAHNVLELAAELGVPKIIHTSTIAVFGNTRGEIVDETYQCELEDMASEYERTKWRAHYKVAAGLQKRGAPLIIVQPGIVTGAADPGPHMLQVRFYLNRLPIGFGAKSGSTWVHVDDVADGHILAAERGRNGEAYIISGPALTWKQTFQEFEKITRIAPPKLWIPGWMIDLNRRVLALSESVGLHLPLSADEAASQADCTFWATSKKAEREIGWKPRPVQETFREMLEYEMNKK